MFCNTPQVNQLTALLIAHNIQHMVVCPGSRNATIVHNLHIANNHFKLHPITDERSAAFVALGIALATQEAVGVCVTSGSALLNCIPAVAEAYYRHIPLLVISADRPQSWIGQLDGQTLPQVGALLPYCPTFNLCEPRSHEDEWHNNRNINEAIISLHQSASGPAHINVPISEPMFNFTTSHLPVERKITSYYPSTTCPLPQALIDVISKAQLPTLLIGQYERGDIRNETALLSEQGQMLVLPEVISDVEGNFRLNAFDTLEHAATPICPDVIVHIGGNFVHKRFKSLIRNSACKVIRISNDDHLADTFCHLEANVKASPLSALSQLCQVLPHHNVQVQQTANKLDKVWTEQKRELDDKAYLNHDFHYALTTLHQLLAQQSTSYSIHLANSSAIRAASNVFESGKAPIFCNRGTNGIEGSLSTAVGYATAMWGLSIVVIGDLSFFYDTNALWNTHLPHNLRILLVNNHHGGIFDKLPGLSASPARDALIAAGHQTFTAKGIAECFKLGYLCTNAHHDLVHIMKDWLSPSKCAQILEVDIK